MLRGYVNIQICACNITKKSKGTIYSQLINSTIFSNYGG